MITRVTIILRDRAVDWDFSDEDNITTKHCSTADGYMIKIENKTFLYPWNNIESIEIEEGIEK
jgi:hypothetical protein